MRAIKPNPHTAGPDWVVGNVRELLKYRGGEREREQHENCKPIQVLNIIVNHSSPVCVFLLPTSPSPSLLLTTWCHKDGKEN
jgi:hypothetical protein